MKVVYVWLYAMKRDAFMSSFLQSAAMGIGQERSEVWRTLEEEGRSKEAFFDMKRTLRTLYTGEGDGNERERERENWTWKGNGKRRENKELEKESDRKRSIDKERYIDRGLQGLDKEGGLKAEGRGTSIVLPIHFLHTPTHWALSLSLRAKEGGKKVEMRKGEERRVSER